MLLLLILLVLDEEPLDTDRSDMSDMSDDEEEDTLGERLLLLLLLLFIFLFCCCGCLLLVLMNPSDDEEEEEEEEEVSLQLELEFRAVWLLLPILSLRLFRAESPLSLLFKSPLVNTFPSAAAADSLWPGSAAAQLLND